MSIRYIGLLGSFFISLLTLSLTQSIEAQVQSFVTPPNNAPLNNGSLMEFPVTIFGSQNPETGVIQIRNWTINDQDNSNNEFKNIATEDTLPQDLKQLASNCNAILNNGELITTNYIIIGKIGNSSILSNMELSPVRLDLHDITNSDSDKILLQSQNGFIIEPQIVNVVCQYGDSLLNNTGNLQSKGKFISLFSEHCPNQFKDTIYRLDGQFNHKFNLNFTSLNDTTPNIKIALQKETKSNKVNGYISNYRIGDETAFSTLQGNFTFNSISISCSLQPLS
jgi:hypothetical protein